jgi:hypothetical protein
MTQGMRSRLSPAEKTDIWSRWKSGQSLHEIGRAMASRIAPFAVFCCFAKAFLPPLADALV